MNLYRKPITSVEDAIELVESDDVRKQLFEGVDELDPSVAVYKFPFGIWFRGQNTDSWKLEPHALRIEKMVPGATGVGAPYNESNLFYHFQLRVPEHRSTHSSTFDWLCLMQHYGVPTRLLDWSESVLTALFFAVDDPDFDNKQNSALFCLNARKLNTLASIADESTMCVPTSLDVGLRAQMALARTREQWADRIAILESTDIWDRDILKSIIMAFKNNQVNPDYEAKLRMPAAVFPNRSNGRLLLQTGTFTISGGQARRDGVNSAKRLPEAMHLDDITAGSQGSFLLKCIVSANHRKKIRETLRRLGIHHGSLFPELENQARFIKEHWRPR